MEEKLRRFWPFIAGFVVIFILGGLFYFRYFTQSKNLSKPVVDGALGSLEIENQTSGVSSDHDRIQILEAAVLDLAKQVGELKRKIEGSSSNTLPSGTSGTSGSQDLSTITATLTTLQSQVAALQQSSGVSTSTKRSPMYIPLGWVGTASSQSWTTITTQGTIINSADYPGYTSAQFEVNLQAYQGNGTAYAQLYDNDDGLVISGSSVSTTSSNYTWVSSGTFQLASGQKTYYMQLKNTTAYPANVSDARIRINF